jgi:excisionase family DNA binding protein
MSRRRSESDGLPPGRLFATAPETAQLFRSDERTIRRALERGEIPGFRVGQHWRVPVAWLRQQAGLDGDGAPAA